MTTRSIKAVLLIEDNPGDARLLREMFREQGPHDTELAHVQSMAEAEEHLARHPADLVLLDLGLPDAQGLEAVRRARTAAPRSPLVVLTGLDDESMAAQALQEGAQDYLIKGQIETRGLMRALRYAVERKIMEEALFVEKERAQVTLDCIGDAVICTDVSANLTFLNVVAETMTGWPRKEAEGRRLGEIFRITSGAGGEIDLDPTKMAGGQDGYAPLPSNCILIRRDGFEIPVEHSIAPIHDRAGQATGAVIVFRDVSAARANALRIAHTAEHDFLTGLPNRMLLNDRIDQAIALARRHGSVVAVLFLDLDGFKHVNDTLGHPTGDRLLQSIATRLMACVRGADTVSRQGGDEFVVLLSDLLQSDDAAISAGRMLQAVAGHHSFEENRLHVTTSIGISVYPDDGLDAETLIKNADTAMYQAKQNGRHGYQFFKPAMNVRAAERRLIEESLRRAVERKEFSLHYQPKIDLTTGAITGAEALIRWMHPVRGAIPPAQFISIAEHCGLIQSIGNWVLREACTQARAWLDTGLPLGTLAVNISAIELRYPNFLECVLAILADTSLDPRTLELELTESALMTHPDSTACVLQTLRGKGVRVAVDDFGTGHSSLSYFRQFPVDALKIDESFIRGIAAAPDEAHLVSAAISMGRSLKLRVVAQGVERREELAFLQAHRCDEAQGYYLGRPMPPEQFSTLLRTGLSGPGFAPRHGGTSESGTAGAREVRSGVAEST